MILCVLPALLLNGFPVFRPRPLILLENFRDMIVVMSPLKTWMRVVRCNSFILYFECLFHSVFCRCWKESMCWKFVLVVMNWIPAVTIVRVTWSRSLFKTYLAIWCCGLLSNELISTWSMEASILKSSWLSLRWSLSSKKLWKSNFQ